MAMSTNDYDFVTDRLAIGNVASRATPGFCAVVSLLATQPWDEVTGAPEILGAYPLKAESNQPWEPCRSWEAIRLPIGCVPVLHIDISDGETRRVRPDNGEMNRKFYSRIIKEMRDVGVEELGVFFIGESFLCQWLPEAIAEAKDIGYPYVFLTTNGSAATLSNVYGSMIYNDTNANNQGVCYNYFGGVNSVTSGTLTVVWNANGIARITV